jgi:hypothetical protein
VANHSNKNGRVKLVKNGLFVDLTAGLSERDALTIDVAPVRLRIPTKRKDGLFHAPAFEASKGLVHSEGCQLTTTMGPDSMDCSSVPTWASSAVGGAHESRS